MSPLNLEGEIAHYYRFAEIYNGKKLIPKLGVGLQHRQEGAHRFGEFGEGGTSSRS